MIAHVEPAFEYAQEIGEGTTAPSYFPAQNWRAPGGLGLNSQYRRKTARSNGFRVDLDHGC